MFQKIFPEKGMLARVLREETPVYPTFYKMSWSTPMDHEYNPYSFPILHANEVVVLLDIPSEFVMQGEEGGTDLCIPVFTTQGTGWVLLRFLESINGEQFE